MDIATWHCLLLIHARWTLTGHTPSVLITRPWMFPASTPPPSPSPAPNPTPAPSSDRPSSPTGARAEAHGPDGGGEPAQGLRQWPHLPHQLHLRQQRLRDIHVRGRPAHQPLAPGHHRPELQYPFLPRPRRRLCGLGAPGSGISWPAVRGWLGGLPRCSASSGGCLLAHSVSEAQVWDHDEFIYENFKTAAAEGYL